MGRDQAMQCSFCSFYTGTCAPAAPFLQRANRNDFTVRSLITGHHLCTKAGLSNGCEMGVGRPCDHRGVWPAASLFGIVLTRRAHVARPFVVQNFVKLAHVEPATFDAMLPFVPRFAIVAIFR